MTTREVLSNMLLGFMAAGLGSAMVFPLDAVCASPCITQLGFAEIPTDNGCACR